jgi:hypothetical protein
LEKVNVKDKNFTISEEYLPLTQNGQSVKFDYSQAQIGKISADLAGELRKNLSYAESRLSDNPVHLGSEFMTGKFNDHIRIMFQEEWETWELLKQLTFAEDLYFDKARQREESKDFKANFCPRNIQTEAMHSQHQSTIIHAVASWLENIY